MSNNNNASSTNQEGSSSSSSSSSYVSNYGIELQWPAQIMTASNKDNQQSSVSSSSSTLEAKAAQQQQQQQPPIRTSNELLQHRLLEAGILYDVPVSLGVTAETCHAFVVDLERTGCFHSVQVEIGNAPPSSVSTTPTVSTSTTTTDSSPQQQQQLRVYLDEKKWYRLHLGAGLKTSGGAGAGADWTSNIQNNVVGGMFSSSSTSSDVLQQATQVEASFGLRNLTGCLDQTDFQYTVDLKQTASFQATHERPLYTFLPHHYNYSSFLLGGTGGASTSLRDTLLLLPHGSQWTCSSKIAIQTVDYEWMRSYKEFQRMASCRISNQHSIPPQAPSLCTSPEQAAQLHALLIPPNHHNNNNNNRYYWGLEWISMIRDIVPRRHYDFANHHHHHHHHSHYFATMQASPQVVAQAGSTVKHSLTGLIRKAVPSSSSTGGLGGHGLIELALPLRPGDVQFVKYHAGIQGRWPLLSMSNNTEGNDNDNLTLHGSFQTGFLQSWSGGGGARKQQSSSSTSSSPPSVVRHYEQQPPTLSDRFYVGGPGQFRGFLPGGIGPRAVAKSSSSSSSSSLLSPGGDALGGDFYYTATAILSAPLILPMITTSSTTTDSSSSSSAWPFRCFGFCTMGTCIGNVLETPVSSILRSSRLCVGVGMATTVGAAGGGLPRIELTYAWPLRYGPHDARRNFQWAIGISID